MASVGVTRVHSASFVSASQPGEVRLWGAEIVVMIAAAQLSLSSVASTKPILLDLNRTRPRVSCCYLSLHNISASSWVINSAAADEGGGFIASIDPFQVHFIPPVASEYQ